MKHHRLETIGDHFRRCGVSRRSFLEFCGRMMVAAPFGLALTDKVRAQDVAETIEKARRPAVIWLHFQDCTGCTETLLRTSQPDVAELILHLISLDYHETLMVGSGKQAEAALHDSMKENEGKYILIVEGSIPRKENGIYAKIAGKTAIDSLKEVASKAGAIIAMGSCASWGGIPSTGPNPTDACGVDAIIKDKPIVNIPGCPPNPYTLLGVALQYATAGTLPALDDEKRPLFAFDRYIHDHCPRRAHFDAGEFVEQFGDEGHEKGWCLYQMGCKGPITHAGCSTRHFNETPGVWPIGIGAPCVGCTERDVAFQVPIFEKSEVPLPTPPRNYPGITQPTGSVNPIATGLVGFGVGAVVAGAYVASRKFSERPGDESVPGDEKSEE
ncbi:MAG: hydrogenase small subunit [Planctomycetota bacterium]|jgi:hydrogenase small subunit